jgi:hypothetical protein
MVASANGTFYNSSNNHRKTFSNKLPSIQGNNNATGVGGAGGPSKTVDSSLSNTYYSRE